jgi:RpiB/LacA/LacB family sugar-phosphate isomerase
MDVIDENILGIIISGTWIGSNMEANKVEWIRASLCNNFNQIRWGREEHNMNILCLSAFEEEYLEVQNIINTYIKSEYKK